MKEYKWNLFDDIWSWSGSIRNKSARGSCLGMGTRLIFCVFFSLFKLWSVVSPRMFEQNLADLFEVSMYCCLTYLKSFIILAQSILKQRAQVQYPLFSTFQKIGYFWIQIKVAWKQLATESFFIFVDIFQYFKETANLLLPSCRPVSRCYSPSNTTSFGHFWPKNGAIRLSCTAVSLEK